MKISTFMNRNQTIPDDFVEVLDDLDEEEQNQLNIDERIKNLKTELGEQQKILTVTEYNKKRAIYEYLKRLDENGKGKMKASKEAAQLIFIDCAPNRARSIQYWANFWLQNNHLPMSRQGKHQKTIRLIDDEDIAVKCHTWIRSQGGTTTPLKFKEFVEQKLLINSGITKKKTIAKATATRWLNVLGYSFQSQKQGTYYDGHERPDVVEYRKLFLDKIYSYESEFLSEEYGRLKLNAQQHQENSSIPQEARTYLQPGKDREGYWTSEHLIDQFEPRSI
ncbi:unnamed protein product [Rhizophagus irregularis]|nr:unnamed protein product [Rhizophagus irregularis]